MTADQQRVGQWFARLAAPCPSRDSPMTDGRELGTGVTSHDQAKSCTLWQAAAVGHEAEANLEKNNTANVAPHVFNTISQTVVRVWVTTDTDAK